MAEEYLEADKMDVVRRVFVEAFNHVYQNILPGDGKDKITEFVLDLILRERPYLLVTTNGIKHAVEMVMTDDQKRDFIFELSYNFFARWGGIRQNVDGLAVCLASGAAQACDAGALNAIPNDVYDRLNTFDDVRDTLACNKWLMIVLLVRLYVEYDTTKFVASKK